MIELENAPQKKLSYDEIKRAYDFDEILSRRLQHMLDSKYIEKNSGYYMNTKKGRLEAEGLKFLKEFLNLGKGG
ncbi:MAG: hypothetical protein Q6359_00290 [Candidatus Brocadiales bacterium]|nr:hypothetical protein [Candidatus Brocadiales bacterium]